MALYPVSIPSPQSYHDSLFMTSFPLKYQSPSQTTILPREVFSQRFREADSTGKC